MFVAPAVKLIMAETPEEGTDVVTKLLNRQAEIEARLAEIAVVTDTPLPAAVPKASTSQVRGTRRNSKAMDTPNDTTTTTSSTLIPYTPKTIDTHWDFVMKEMMWLGADFQGERKRQISSAKKLASRYVHYDFCHSGFQVRLGTSDH